MTAGEPPDISDSSQAAEGMRLEYKALRDQIAEADRTCVALLGVLMTATLALTGLSIERSSPEIGWLLGPLWLVGHSYLAEKRSIIVHTARYLRTEIESRHEGLRWETWHHRQVGGRDGSPQPPRFYPFYLETGIASIAVLACPLLVMYASTRPLLAEPWFPLSLAVLAVFAAVAVRSLRLYTNFERYMARLE